MNRSKTIGLPNALIIVMDPTAGVIFRSMEHKTIASTDSCVVVGCLSEADGETEITLGLIDEVGPEDHLLFTGELKTPSRRIALISSHNDTLLEAETAQPMTSVRIWGNDLSEPDKVIVGFR